MNRRAPTQGSDAGRPAGVGLLPKTRWLMLLTLTSGVLSASACSDRRTGLEDHPTGSGRLVVVVAPVLNLSNTGEVDVRKITDTVASELLSFPALSVIPVNLSAAALARRGKTRVETPQDALELAREFAADAAVVAALTEFEPFHPLRVGLVMQWYEPAAAGGEGRPGDLSWAGAEGDSPGIGPGRAGPTIQVQRVYSAAHEEVVEDVRRYGRRRDGGESPYGWRKHVVSQELFVRYCCWATIRTMLAQSSTYQSLHSEQRTPER